jgi:hypothetical protein
MRPVLFAVIAGALLAAGSAGAADLVYRNSDSASILTDFDGRAVWELEALCAGHYRATAAYWTARGKADRARAARVQSAAATNDVVSQLERDRGITDRNEALHVGAPVEQVGFRVTEKALARDAVSPDGEWNYWRSVCKAANRLHEAQ